MKRKAIAYPALVFFMLIICFAITSCDANQTSNNPIDAITPSASATVSVLPLPPDGSPESSTHILYNNVEPDQLKEYVNRLVAAGFILEQTKREIYLSKNNIFLHIYDDTVRRQCLIYTIVGMQRSEPAALTCAQAKEIIGNDAIAVLERNVPELYERTGAQLFYAVSKDQNSKEFWPLQYIVKGNNAVELQTEYKEYMVCDIDSDGQTEMLYIKPGVSKGDFGFNISAIGFSGDSVYVKYNTTFWPVKYCDLAFQKGEDNDIYLVTNEYSFDGTRSSDSIWHKLRIKNGEITTEGLQ